MASVAGSGTGDFPEWWAERNKEQAARLLKAVIRGRGRTIQPPSLPHVGGDHPRPQGLFVHVLLPPFVWPTDSETLMKSDSEMLKDASKSFDDAARDVQQAANSVLNGGVWVGESADAAYDSYREAMAIKFRQADVADAASDFIGRAARDVRSTKKSMYNENKQAHEEIEKFLHSGSGQSLAQVAVIVGKHRAMIQGYSSELQGFVTQYTTQFTNHFKEEGGPGGNRQIREAGNGTRSDSWSDPDTPPQTGPGDPTNQIPGPGKVKADHWSDGVGDAPRPGGPLSPHWSDDTVAFW